MNTPVSFEIKQFLYDKGWRYELGVDETGYRVEHSLAEQRWNEGDLTYVDITIAEVVMWLYEKHEIWIISSYELAEDNITKEWFWIAIKDGEEVAFNYGGYTSPTEAYESAIKYCLEQII